VFTAMGLRLGENILYYMVVTFSITYLATQVDVDTSTILGLMLIAHVVHFIAVPIVGGMTDRFGRRPVYGLGVLLMVAWGFAAFPMFETANNFVILAAIILGLLIHALMYAGQPSIMAEMFPTRMRYSGVSLGYQVTSIVAGSMAPIIATALLSEFGSWVPVAIYISVAAAITFIAVLALRETRGSSLHELDEEDRVRFLGGTRAAGTSAPAQQRDERQHH
jgi:MFS family permease